MRKLSQSMLLALILILAHSGISRSAPDPGLHPSYQMDLSVDYNLLTYRVAARITIPATPADPLQNASFFIYANAGGPGGGTHQFVAVDSVSLNGAAVPFTNQGPVLHVALPHSESQPFTLQVLERGVAPRGPANSGTLMDMMGDVGGDLGGLMGGLLSTGQGAGQPQQPEGAVAPAPRAKPAVKDYGLYTYAAGVLSLGAYWYPQLAVRRSGQWVDQPPNGLGDVEYVETANYTVTIHTQPGVVIAAPGDPEAIDAGGPGRPETITYSSPGARDFAVLMSDNFVVKRRTISIDGRAIPVEAYTLQKDAGRASQVLDYACGAVQDYSRRFGPYPFDRFKVVEGTIRGGAGGMEFSGMTSIASALYGDLDKQINDLAKELGAGDLGAITAELNAEDNGAAGAPAPGAAPPAANAQPDNAATGLLQSLLGSQKAMLDSLLEVTIAHETAHQWWAMAVGSDSQRNPFVDESLAQFSAMLYFEDRYGPAKAKEMWDVNVRMAYSMGRMLGGGDAPANLPTSAYHNDLQYAAVVYGKATLYYDVLRHQIGDRAFFDSLQEYYRDYHGRLAGPKSLLKIVEDRVPAQAAQVDALYQHWIEQAHGDQDIQGGTIPGLSDLLGGLLGGGAGLLGDLLGGG